MGSGVPELLVPLVSGLWPTELIIVVVLVGLVWAIVAAVRRSARSRSQLTQRSASAADVSSVSKGSYIFLSYRRADSLALAGRIADHLERRFPGLNVFYDVDSLVPGVNFRSVIGRSLQQSQALLAVVDRSWTSSTASGRRRLDEPDDWVAFELHTAAQLGKPVIPLIDPYATMPTAEMLPPDLAWFADQQAFYLHKDVSFDYDMARLDAQLGNLLPMRKPAVRREPAARPRSVLDSAARVLRVIIGSLVVVIVVIVILQLT